MDAFNLSLFLGCHVCALTFNQSKVSRALFGGCFNTRTQALVGLETYKRVYSPRWKVSARLCFSIGIGRFVY